MTTNKTPREQLVIYISYNKEETELLLHTLEYNGITATHQPIGKGVMPAMFKDSLSKGEQISVPADQEEQAKALIEALGLHKEDTSPPITYKKSTMWLARIGIGLIVAIILFRFYCLHFNIASLTARF
ncbi:hypothetical protein M2145_000853 [Lachnospiraceae bacterium PF1-21]